MNISKVNKLQQKLLTVLLFSGLYFLLSFTFALAATLSVSPSTGVYTAGQNFTARVIVNTNGAGINAADGALKFNPAELSVVSISKGAIFNLWTAEPSFSNSAGTISFSGGNPTGYSGTNGTILTITFRAKNAGTSKVTFSSGSVLAADGRGTNVLTSMGGGTYTIAAQDVAPEPEVIEYVAPANTPARPTIESSTHPDPSQYYQETTAKLSWTLPNDVTGVRTLLDSNSGSIPTKVYESPIRDITIDNLEEGVQYFHIQFRNADGWGRVAHYRLAVDTENPSQFEITLPEGADLSNPEQTLLVKVEDKTSLVKRFLIQLDGGEPYEYIDESGSSTIKLPALEPGHHSVIIEAFDEAGNSLIDTFSFSILAFDKPQFTDYPSEINEEVIPVIKGITRPNSKVEVFLSKIGTESQTYNINSDESGQFIFIPEGTLSLGVYELSAVAIDQYGAKSELSDVVRIAVQQPGYIEIGSFLVSVMSIIVPLIALLALLILVLWFFFLRLRSWRGGVRKESREALSILKAEFGKLRSELDEQAEALKKSRKTGKLTKAEASLVSTLETQFGEAEKRVEKEIADVEDIVD